MTPLKEGLELCYDIERIGNPFKQLYTELFNWSVDYLFKECCKANKKMEETHKTHTLLQSKICNMIQLYFMNPLFDRCKDIRWLLSLMLLYPALFKFTEEHYKSAIQNGVARDNLYCIKKTILLQ